MTKYLIVAINHGDTNDGRILSEGCRARFKEQIAPIVTDRSLILMEGFYRNEMIRPAHSRYQAAKNHFGTALKNVNPTFAGFDTRQRNIVSEEQLSRLEARIDSWEMFCRRNFLANWSTLPSTPQEAENFIRSVPELPLLRRTPTHEEVDLAKWINATNRRFDREYIQAMRQHGPRHDLCVVVTGSVHAISIGFKTKNPIIYLIDDEPGNVREMYFAYLADYVWPSIVIEGRTAT